MVRVCYLAEQITASAPNEAFHVYRTIRSFVLWKLIYGLQHLPFQTTRAHELYCLLVIPNRRDQIQVSLHNLCLRTVHRAVCDMADIGFQLLFNHRPHHYG